MSVFYNAVFVIPRLYIQNFNTTSAPFTWGAPAPSATIGFMHALQRKLPIETPVRIVSVGYVAHDVQAQTNGRYVKTFNLTRNPVGRDGKTPGIVEEGRAHMEMSLVLGIDITDESWLTDDSKPLARALEGVYEAVLTMRFAGGMVWPSSPRRNARRPYASIVTEENEEQVFRRFRRSMLPGSALVSRQDWLQTREEERRAEKLEGNALDAWLDAGRVRWTAEVSSAEDPKTPVEWVSSRKKGDGWIVPIPVGFVAISPLYPPGEVQRTRDPSVPFRFVETAYSVGEWVSPHRLRYFSDLLWYPVSDHEAGTYICENKRFLDATAQDGE